ncbi:MAG: hypothetical protein K0R76_47 [Alphaproteobacteria bacterium]|jgi:adhesin HecA-like repeat protein|nr:hypothetical protein [Alphaproteobacteria bacterium]
MLSERLIRSLARVVLSSYVTQLFAPLIHACEGEGLAARPANPSINNLQTRNSQHLSQAGLQDPLLSQVPFQDLPTLSFQLNALSSEANSGGGYRFSIEQTRILGGVTTLDHRWEQAFSLRDLASSQALAYPVNHPWMRYLSLHLSESGQLTAHSLSQPGGLYQGYNYVFNVEGDLYLSHLLTNGTIAVQEANQISAEGTVFAQKKMLLTARKGISTRSRDPQKPTLLLSDQEISLKAPHLDNENSRIKAPVIRGQLGGAGQGGISLNNTNGVIRAENLLDLYSATAIVNTGGVIGCQAGLAKIVGGSSLQNERGRIKGHQQLDLSLKEGLQNQGGQLRSQQKAILKLGTLDNKEGAIKTGGLLDLDVEQSITNTGGTIASRSGQAKVNGLSLQNERGQIKGHQQLDLTIKKGIDNPGGQLWSQGDTTIHAYSLVNQKESEVKGRNLTISVTQALRTDDATSHLIADHVMRLTANTLYQASPFVAKTVYVNTLNNLNLVSAQFVETLSLFTENGPINYRPNELQASRLLSLTTRRIPLTLTIPLKTPGAFEATAPEIINKTALVANDEITLVVKDKITLNPFSTSGIYPVRNEGDMVSATKGITIHADGFSHERGRVTSGENFDFAGKNLRLRSSAQIGGDIHIAAKGYRDIDFAQLEVQGTLHLTLLAGQVKLMQPITIPGQLELDRDGDNAEPFNLLVNLIAKKGLKIRLPSAPLIIGAEEERQPMVKLQAEEGFLDIQSKSLDIVKAQLFSRTGMRWEVQEKQIRIGRGVVENINQAFNYRWDARIDRSLWQPGDGSLRRLGDLDLRYNGCCASKIRSSNHFIYSFVGPFKQPNGTFVTTEGPFTMLSPYGALIDQAEVEVRGGDWNVITQFPIRNEGGKIFIQGNTYIHGLHGKKVLGASLQNVLLTYTSFQLYPSSFTYPLFSPGEITINGDLKVSRLENIGSFTYIAGRLIDAELIEQHCTPIISGGAILWAIMDNYIQEKFLSNVSIGKAWASRQAKDIQLQGTVQSPLVVVEFKGTARVGKLANYRRPPTPPFQQMKGFMDVHRPTALFQPALDAATPWINQPTVPLTWDVVLPPAVGLGANGLYLLGDEDKLLLHPLQEVDALPRVLSAQLQRGYLDAQHPDALATYIMGRHQAYSLYQKFFAPKALEGAAQPQTSSQNPQHALNAFSSTLVNTLSEQEVAQVKFMMLYYGMAYEGKTVHLPMSWVSKQYDNPKLRNPDGGLFADIVLLKGLPGAKLECVSTIHGETVLGIDVSHTLLERQNYRYVTYHTNTTHKKGSWWRSDSHHSETVAIHHSEAQTNTGNLSTGPEGQMVLKGDLSIKGGSIEGGKKGITVDIPHLHVIPTVNTSVGSTSSSAGGTSITRHFPVYDIPPVSVHSTGGVKGRIDDMTVEALQITAQQGDIDLEGKGDANLLACQREQSLGAMVSKQGKTVTIQEASTQVAVPCAFLAFNGKVILRLGGKLYGVAPRFLGKTISLHAREHDIFSLLMANKVTSTSETSGVFSKQTATSMQETLSVLRTIFEGDEVYIGGEKAGILGALINGGVLYDMTQEGVTLGPKVIPLKFRNEVSVSQPFSFSNYGTEGWQEAMVPTTLNVNQLKRVPTALPDPGTMKLISVEKNPALNIVGVYEETFYQLKRYQTSWARHEQLIPDEALVVVALGIAIATQGVGGAWMQGLLTSTFGTVPGTVVAGGVATAAMVPAVTLTATGAAMASAGFTTLLCSATTSFFRTGDAIATAREVCSPQSLRSLGISVASAGIANKVGGLLDVNMAPGLKPFTEHLQEHAIRNGASLAVNTAAGQRTTSSTVLRTVADTVIDAVAARAANHRGALPRDTFEASALHKIGHAVDGFCAGYISGLVSGEDPIKKGLARGFGAAAGEMFAEGLKNTIERSADVARIATAGIGVALGLDAHTVFQGADCAISNNHMTSVGKKKQDEEEDEEKEGQKVAKNSVRANKPVKSRSQDNESRTMAMPASDDFYLGTVYGEYPQDTFQRGYESIREKKAYPSSVIEEGQAQTECRAAPFQRNRRNTWPTIPTAFEKTRSVVEGSWGCLFETKDRFVESGYDLRKLDSVEVCRVGAAYGFTAIGAVAEAADTLLGGALSTIGSGIHTVAESAGTGVRRGTRMLTGYDRLAQNLGDGTEFGLKALATFAFPRAVQGAKSTQFSTRNKQGAVKGSAKQTTALFQERPLLPGDIAKETRNLHVQGTMSGDGRKITVKIDEVRNTSLSDDALSMNIREHNWRLNKPREPLPPFVETVVNQLINTSKEMGAKTLQVEAMVANDRLAEILQKRYKAVDTLGTLWDNSRSSVKHLVITVPLKTQSPPTISVKVAQKVSLGGQANVLSVHEIWNMPPFKRGVEIHQIVGENLPKNTKTVDCLYTLDLDTRLITSIKTLDLRAKTYLNPSKLESKLKKYIDKLAGYNGEDLGRYCVEPHQIQGRMLELAFPHAGTLEQQRIIKLIEKYGKSNGVIVHPFIY